MIGVKNINVLLFSEFLKDPLYYLRLIILELGRVNLKGCVLYIFASLFLGLNETIHQMKKNIFYFTSKPLFALEKIKF